MKQRDAEYSRRLKELAGVLAGMRDGSEIYDILYALLTKPERKRIALRWWLIRLLDAGLSQRAVASTLGISLCKITRGSRELKRGRPAFRKAVRMAKAKSKQHV